MAYELEIKQDCRIYVFAYVDYNISPATPSGTNLIPLGWNDVPEPQLDSTKMNICSWSDYDFENNCSKGNWSTPFVVTGTPLNQTLDYGYNFGYSNSPFIPPSTLGKIPLNPTGTYMWMEKYRIVNSEAIRTLDFILINNEVSSFTSVLRGKIINEYEHSSESMADRRISNAIIHSNSTDLDDNYSGKEYVEFENEKYYLVPTEIKKVALDQSNGKYKYTLLFINEYEKLKTTPFKDIASIESEPQFYTNQNKVFFVNHIGELKDRINACLQKSYSSFDYSVIYDLNYIPNTTLYKEVNAENISIFDAIKLIYDVFGVPFHFKEKQIIVGYEPEITEHVFSYKDGIKNITKSSRKERVVTSISGKGGQTNIPFRYPLIRDLNGDIINHPYTSTYLMPTCYVDSVRKKVQYDAVDYDPNMLIVNSYEAVPNDVYMNENGEYETTLYENHINSNNYTHEFCDFEDIHPTITGIMYAGHRIDMVKSVAFESGDPFLSEDGSSVISYFYIELYPLGFDLYAHAIETGEMTILMNSGDCSGCGFKVLANYNDVWSTYNVYFAKQNSSGSFKSSDFVLFYDKSLIGLMEESLSYLKAYEAPYSNTLLVERDADLITSWIKNVTINGKSVRTILKESIDKLMLYEDIYSDIASHNYCPNIVTGENVINNVKEEVYLLYNNWNTYTNIQFARQCHEVYGKIIGLDFFLNYANNNLLKDYADRVYPPTPPYLRGDYFITKVRNTADYPDSTNSSIVIKVLKDEATFSTILPNAFMQPKANDTFAILNIDLPENYIIAGQRRLDKALKEKLQSSNKYNPNYSIKISQNFISKNLSIYAKIIPDTFVSFYYGSTLIRQQLKKVIRKFTGTYPDLDIEFYNEEDKPKTQGNRLLTLQQVLSSTTTTINRVQNTQRKLKVSTDKKVSDINERANAIFGIANSKSTTIQYQPIPPYQLNSYWNDNGVMKICINAKPEGASFNTSDFIVVAKTRQFIKTVEEEYIGSEGYYEQLEERVTKKLRIDNDSSLHLLNSAEYKSENILIITNTNTGKAVSLQLDMADLVDYMIDSSETLLIDIGCSAYININFTDDLIAVITVKNGLTKANK